MDLAGDYSTAGMTSRPPVLLACGSGGAGASAGAVATLAAIDGAGLRAAQVPLDALAQRLALQAATSLLWVETSPDDPADAVAAAFGAVANAVADGEAHAVVCTDIARLDLAAALLGDGQATIIVDPTPVERVSALSLALARPAVGARLNDVAAEASGDRLRELSDEVARIAANLARLAGTQPPVMPTLVDRHLPVGASADAPGTMVSSEHVRAMIRARRLRARYFDEALFADPAWDMLLDLFQAEISQHRVSVSSLCIAAAVPPTTALRWIKTMMDHGLFLRRADPHDGRRVFVELSPSASAGMQRYFSEVGNTMAMV